ncbi:hypothetical protein Cgig2_010015 [Carnegiea gigantea]|uniref:Uncharacterized protein n=1 Tax=Carnegiea gigantea TaxID=171969 RepID=A0A9Q1Q524_9CARY|nr:hypothetical protein Cgig2_010015 [Carnegiea gigantea]
MAGGRGLHGNGQWDSSYQDGNAECFGLQDYVACHVTVTATHDSLESRDAACKEFFAHLNKSLEVLGGKLPTDARVAYSKMAEEVCSLLLSDSGEGSTRETQLGCYDTVASAPLPEDVRMQLHSSLVFSPKWVPPPNPTLLSWVPPPNPARKCCNIRLPRNCLLTPKMHSQGLLKAQPSTSGSRTQSAVPTALGLSQAVNCLPCQYLFAILTLYLCCNYLGVMGDRLINDGSFFYRLWVNS